MQIDISEIQDDVYEAGCRILSKSIRKFFDDPKNRRGYEEWMKTPEGQRANLFKEERAKFDKNIKGAKP